MSFPYVLPFLQFSKSLTKSLSLKPSFKEVTKNVYKTHCNQTDFHNEGEKVGIEINSWVEKETNGLIKDVISPRSIDALTGLICINALYFHGDWDEPFDSIRTRNHDFHILDGSTSSVPFMTNWIPQMISAHDGFKVLRLPYNQEGKGRHFSKTGHMRPPMCDRPRYNDNRRLSMYMFLPDANDGLFSLIENMKTDSEFLERHLPLKRVEVGNFRIPKFKLSFVFGSCIIDLGLMISDIAPEDLPGIAESGLVPEILESDVIQKAFIQVDENGTEATAATSIRLGRCFSHMLVEKVDFVADHPFLFLIRDDTSRVILLLGQVINPTL